jgi:sulfonate transport system substrate-binding protein
MAKSTLRIGGVPEHFNLPWQLAAEHDIFTSQGIELSWTFYAGGTGAMTKALSNGELDIAILLTEGFVSAASQGLKARIAKVYIETPLVWGIYSGANSRIKQAKDALKKKLRHLKNGLRFAFDGDDSCPTKWCDFKK